MYASFNDGASWVPFQLNLPIVPITDLAIKEGDLIVATQGRSFWVLDDLGTIRQLSDVVVDSQTWLFQPRDTYRMPGSTGAPSDKSGQNPPVGVVVRYFLAESPDTSSATIRILESDGTEIKSFAVSSDGGNKGMTVDAGLNQFVWDMRYPDAEGFEGLIMWGGRLTGPKAVPGEYQARLVVADDSTTVAFRIVQDPRSSSTQSDLQAQFDYLIKVRDKLTETHVSIKQIREIRGQVNEILGRVESRDDAETVRESGDEMLERISAIEKSLYQTRNRSSQDPLNYPIKLNNKLAAVASVAARGDFRPTSQSVEVRDELTARIDVELEAYQ